MSSKILKFLLGLLIVSACTTQEKKHDWAAPALMNNMQEWCANNHLYIRTSYLNEPAIICLDLETGKLKWNSSTTYDRPCPETEQYIYIPYNTTSISRHYSFIKKVNKNTGTNEQILSPKFPFITLSKIEDDLLLFRENDTTLFIDYYKLSDFSFLRTHTIKAQMTNRYLWKVLSDKVYITTDTSLIVADLKGSILYTCKGEFNSFTLRGMGNGVMVYDNINGVTKYISENLSVTLDSNEISGGWANSNGIYRKSNGIEKIDPETGKVEWSNDIRNSFYGFYEGVDIPMMNDSIFIFNENGVSLIDAKSGELLNWSLKASNGSGFNNSYMYKNKIITRNKDSIFCYKIDFK